ncbi:hypothetical protein C8A01DRAFT_41812 [Parachaetomium inaequale]|uniref:AMP-dependent synthetase/ligase domain-containing protein n=1 Tax=Parachaetomium inaequale TaxID=2588326 RepID=A0AAN6SLQ8_9PEZI|nr:hypothetical protein C8A01DRAFT_41812 [Parachaetomium inaequale]
MALETLDEGRPVPAHFTTGPAASCPFPTATAAIRHAASSHPDSVAAIDLSQAVRREISYAQLEVRAQRLAQRLRAAGVGPGNRVPLVVRRSIEMLVGIYAILLCGAQYVPLDGGIVTRATLQTVISQSGGGLVVCTGAAKRRLHNADADIVQNCRLLCVEDELERGGEDEAVESIDLATPEGGCYVIYTSGTTGTPKGVDVTHSNVTNLVCLSPGGLGVRPGSKVGQILNISFDMAAWEIFSCLCNGGTLVLRGSDWAPTLKEIDVLICTPSILALKSPEEFPNIKVVATAGERSNQLLADKWATHGTYYNCCGPTETTIVNTMHRHQPGDPLTIGKPTPNNSVYILDDDLRPVGLGQVGTMWAGGRGISRGYVGLPEMTAKKYRRDPFADDGSMMYNTGDLGRWLEFGEIDILGRTDDQVKVKGFRVELDGVAHVMATVPGVQNAYALLINGEIHAFLHPASFNTQQVKRELEKVLPYYSRPSHLHGLDQIPLTPNGKVDKAALGALAAIRSDADALSAPSDGESAPCHSDLERGTLDSDSQNEKRPASSTDGEGYSSTLDLDKPEGDAPVVMELDADLPAKDLPKFFRNLVYRAFIPYRFLLMLVYLGNIGALAAMYVDGINRAWAGNMVAINLLVAVLIRQDMVVNALFTTASSVPKSWPLWIRASCAKIYHMGGVHAAAATWSSFWLLAANISDVYCSASHSCGAGYPSHSKAFQAISWILTAFFVAVLALALPPFRAKHHDFFERSHRFLGWTMLALFWVQTLLGVSDAAAAATSPSSSYGSALLTTPGFWLLVAATLSIASPWFWLRKVPVVSEVLSPHAVRLHFAYTVPVNGTATRLSFRPLIEWHAFATIPAPQPSRGYPAGYSLVVSNAGDWTRACIQRAPRHVWVRGLPACGVMRIATLFNRVVIVATGSGIGPLLGHIQAPTCATMCLWSTKDPVRTYGRELVDTVRRQIPGAVIWDTTAQGRPDMVKLSYNMARGFGAEAVIIIANRKITTKVVYGLETRGVHAYGAIWDS